MQPYQNYYPQMNNYNQPYNPMLNAQQRLAQMEQQYPQFAQQGQYQPQMQQTQQFVGLNGKIVDDFNMISANDVPMDGNGAIFIKKDGSEIQLRNWTSNGTIQTTSYKPILDAANSNVDISSSETEKLKIGLSDEATEVFMKRFDDIADRIEKLEKFMTNSTTKSSTSRAKKEADAE